MIGQLLLYLLWGAVVVGAFGVLLLLAFMIEGPDPEPKRKH